jgi:lipopolysaccharide biosynthesis protein
MSCPPTPPDNIDRIPHDLSLIRKHTEIISKPDIDFNEEMATIESDKIANSRVHPHNEVAAHLHSVAPELIASDQ